MPFDIKILSNKIEKVKESFENGKFGDALVAALNYGNGLLQERVIVQNQDINGNGFGKYIGHKKGSKFQNRDVFRALFGTTSKTDRKRIKANAGIDLTSYQRKRVNKGRQILKKDLEFTGGLRRAIETQVAEKESEKIAVLNFSTNEVAKIARGQEVQITNIRNGGKGTTKGVGVKIFGFNTKEREQIDEQAVLLINEMLKPK